jgi:uncharacterized protein YdeI (BOF family)
MYMIKAIPETHQLHQIKEMFEDTKGAIRIRISNRQHNGEKMYKRTNNDLQNMHIK